ncbi:branched-chain amino acid ABC transporter permease [Fodinisporobacter ferrooxydans]|uniref:Branched-chain amino acid ABC transporter permease n=1 Tax=Fodinisporobacter ferrooxydans TaxID=2901836 RepID=A0ABY4CF76_9BACL|nr:branched-chain amino acid ABC transporter permease [Alicyclobacillaceae bacterium MYW30-H2]
MSRSYTIVHKRRRLLTWLTVIVALGLPWAVDSIGSVPGYILNLSLIFAIVAVGLNLLTGFSGQVSLGHAAFVVIGSYTSAILTLKVGISFWLALPAAGLMSGIVGFIVGLPAVRLTGNLLAVATLGFGLAIPELVLKWTKLTNGDTGLNPDRPQLFGFSLQNDLFYYYLILLCLAFTLWISRNLLKGKAGRAFQAIRDSEIAATAMGISIVYYKSLVFAISAGFAGIAGSLYAHYVNFISPNDFTIVNSFLFFAMVVLGGLASLPGAILGAVVITILEQATGGLQGFSIVLTGAVMVGVVMFFPRGLIALWKREERDRSMEDEEKADSRMANRISTEVTGEHVSEV